MTSRMLEEIGQTPGIVERLLGDTSGALASAGREIEKRRPRSVVFAARGSSYFAAMYGRHLVETLLGLPVVMAAPVVASTYGVKVPLEGSLVIGLSQGGRSPDILATVEAWKRSAALTVTIVNDETSPLAAAGDLLVPLGCGPEAIAATKSYMSEAAALAAIVVAWSGRRDLATALAGLPAALARSADESIAWLDREPGVVDAMASAAAIQVVSRGYDLATALEVALKLTETGGMIAHGFSATDFRHGPMAASGPAVPLLAFRPEGAAGPSVDEAVAAAVARGAMPWLVGGPAVSKMPHALVLGHGLPPELAPPANIVPGHVLSERVSRARGHDPDSPSGLIKVTLTR